VITAPNIPSLANFRLADALQRELQRPAVIENDANAAAVGEMWQGAARGASTIVCITLGTGVGGGIILNGELWRGADGSAGELGHMASSHPAVWAADVAVRAASKCTRPERRSSV
jgi:glucokinase